MAAPTTGLTIVKRFSYRGDASEEWSNKYLLTGSTPADSAAWRALFDALVLEEKKLYRVQTSVVAGYGYNSAAEDAHAVWNVDLDIAPNTPVPGTMAVAGDRFSGDQACWVRWGLDRMNSKGKRVYLRKYFHDGTRDSVNIDNPAPGYVTALAAFGTKLRDGSFVGGRVITDHLGTAVVGSGVSSYMTTRTLKRRGKRPPS